MTPIERSFQSELFLMDLSAVLQGVPLRDPQMKGHQRVTVVPDHTAQGDFTQLPFNPLVTEDDRHRRIMASLKFR